MITVLIADDQPLIRAGLAAIVESASDLSVVGQAIDGADAVRQARDLVPDVILMDIRMPGTDGLSATASITTEPGLAAVKILVLTTFELDEYVAGALRAGASGFLGKDVEPEELVTAVRAVADGDQLLSASAVRSLIEQFVAQPENTPLPAPDPAVSTLTSREREIVGLVGEGLSNDQIAGRLFLSPLTVKTHVQRSMAKLDTRDRAQLVVAAYRNGLVARQQGNSRWP